MHAPFMTYSSRPARPASVYCVLPLMRISTYVRTPGFYQHTDFCACSTPNARRIGRFSGAKHRREKLWLMGRSMGVEDPIGEQLKAAARSASMHGRLGEGSRQVSAARHRWQGGCTSLSARASGRQHSLAQPWLSFWFSYRYRKTLFIRSGRCLCRSAPLRQR